MKSVEIKLRLDLRLEEIKSSMINYFSISQFSKCLNN